MLRSQDPSIYRAIQGELRRQKEKLELIASENYASEAVLEAQGSVLTNKYAEGYPGKRYYGGCEFVDIVESLAMERAKKLFGAEHANVQPHSGTQANITAYLSVLNPGDTIMGLHLAHGGHLSHGHPLNFSGKFFKVVGVSVRQDTETIDYEEAERLAAEHRPKLILAGASNYSRVFDWERFKKIADGIGAYFMADIAHYAGLIAADIYPSPVSLADFVTSTTHKTLRGPRGGFILCKSQHAAAVDKLNFPGNQGGPLMHVIAAKAVCFGEALRPAFQKYQKQVLGNARALARALQDRGFRIVSGGTDCHLFSVDLRSKSVTGKEAEETLDKAGITVNKNAIPYDPQKPFIASGIRIGTPAVTTRGMRGREMEAIAEFIREALERRSEDKFLKALSRKVGSFCKRFPIYVLLLCRLAGTVWATHGLREIGLPLTNAEAALSLLYANPPLPMTYFRPGDYKLTVLLDVFSVRDPAEGGEETQPVSDVSLEGSMLGWGGGVLLERAFSSRWSLFGMLLGAQLGSGTLTGKANDQSVQAINGGATNKPGQVFQKAESGGSSSVGGIFGVNFRILGKGPDVFALTAFAGPAIFHTSGSGQSTALDISASAPANSGECTESFSGYKCVRRSYKGSFTNFTPALGLQAGIPIRQFILNPYLLIFPNTPDEFTDNIQVDIPASGQTADITELPFFRAISPLNLGLNLTYRPWGLTANLTGSLAAKLISSQAGISNFSILKFQVSKSFGSYPK